MDLDFLAFTQPGSDVLVDGAPVYAEDGLTDGMSVTVPGLFGELIIGRIDKNDDVFFFMSDSRKFCGTVRWWAGYPEHGIAGRWLQSSLASVSALMRADFS
jgi:hypothetical protein